MKIRKIGHCCLVIEVDGKKIMTDPGGWTTGQNEVAEIDFVLITHEHGDHLHIESLKKVLQNNPGCKVVTNGSVGKLLSNEGINFIELNGIEKVDSCDCGGVLVEAYDGKHGEIYEEIGQVQNTGFFIDKTLFYPGDSMIDPGVDVKILAAPVYGPWLTLHGALDYILQLKPEFVFPVHDGMIVPSRGGRIYTIAPDICKDKGINFIHIIDGGEYNF